MSRRFYITTPIYYPNGAPHLGHFYTTVCADVVARYHRLRGDETFFLTGTDWHGIKMVKSAEQAGVTPQQLAETNDQTFIDFWRETGISFDDYIRTSEPRHKQSVAEIVKRMLASDDIYLGHYEGWYDEGQEEFITETEAKAAEYKSVVSGKPLVRYQEPTYFFRLGKYAERVYRAIETDELLIRPAARKNEVLSKLRGWNADLSISRATLKWGIPMPNDPDHVLYVWIDALSNYITALGFGSEDESRLQRYWPADVQLIGKEILWFHAVYWPAMLLSLGLPLPRSLVAHGWWTADGKKMSKSMGNFIDVEKLRSYSSRYGIDALRFYMLRAAPFGNDLDFSEADFAKSYAELQKVLGNCLNRVAKMLGRYRDGVVPAVSNTLEPIDQQLIAQIDALPGAIDAAYDALDLQQVVMLPIDLARATNGYVDATEPFKLAKDPAKAQRLDTVLHLSLQAIRRAVVALLPVLPTKAADALRQLGEEVSGKSAELLWQHLPLGHRIAEPQPLFPQVESVGGEA
jgi:methionyl-tRNA synthetase